MNTGNDCKGASRTIPKCNRNAEVYESGMPDRMQSQLRDLPCIFMVRSTSTRIFHTASGLNALLVAPKSHLMHLGCHYTSDYPHGALFSLLQELYHKSHNYGEHGVSLDPRSSPLSPQPAENAVIVSKSLLRMQQNLSIECVSANPGRNHWSTARLTPGEARTLPLALSQKLLLAATFSSRSLQKKV